MFGVVSVRGNEMHQIEIEQLLGRPLRFRAEATGIGLSCDLHQTSPSYPVVNILEFPAADGIPFRVSQNWRQASHLNVIEDMIHLSRNKMIVEFHEKVLRSIDGKIRALLIQTADIVIGEAEITAQQDLGRAPHRSLKLSGPPSVLRGVEWITKITVWRRDDVSDAVLCRHFQHDYRDVKTLGAVVGLR